MLKGTPVELPDMLNCREQRAFRQQIFLNKYKSTLVSFSLNISGPVKTNAEIKKLFADGLKVIKEKFYILNAIIYEEWQENAVTGDEYLAALNLSAEELKKHMCEIEEKHPLGRLFDIDIINKDGKKMSRLTPRRCFICEKQAQDCARSRRHSVEEMSNKIETALSRYLNL